MTYYFEHIYAFGTALLHVIAQGNTYGELLASIRVNNAYGPSEFSHLEETERMVIRADLAHLVRPKIIHSFLTESPV